MKPELIEILVGYFYKLTGNKLSISFNGSKGYLDNIELMCEGNQEDETNIIYLRDIRLKNNRISKKNISIFYSYENGIRLSDGKSLPNDPQKPNSFSAKENSNTSALPSDVPPTKEDDDLPF